MTHRGPSKPPTRRVRPTFPNAALVVLVGVFVILTAIDLTWLGGVTHPGGSPRGSNSGARQALLTQAEEKVVRVSSYDYRQIDQDVRQGQAATTGVFARSYAQSMQLEVKPQALKLQQVVRCTVQRAGIASITNGGNTAVVLVYAQLATQNSLTKDQPRLDITSIHATLNRQGSEWYIAALVTESG